MNDPSGQTGHPIDQLTEQNRIRGGSRMIIEGKDASAVTEPIAREVIRQVASYHREKKISYGQIARAIGSKPSTLSQVLSWKYAGDWRQIILNLDRWLDDQKKTDLAPKPSGFVLTSVASEIATIANAAIALRTIALVYSPESSGLGKTMALQAIAAEKPGCIFITVERVAANVGGVLDQIAKQLRMSVCHRDAYIFSRIVEELRGTPRLLIVDQAHSLCGAKGDKPFYVLSELHEKTGAPQLWAGTSDIVGYLRRGQAKGQESLAQIRSRIGITRDLMQGVKKGSFSGGGRKLYSVDEIRQIFGRDKMRLAADAALYLLRLANLPDSGALRTCKNLVIMAMTMYQAKHDVLTEELLRAAHRLLVPDNAYNTLQAEIEHGNHVISKVG